MTLSFETRLLDLLPPLYRQRDESGDLAAFLRVPGATLDQLKDLIDRFPQLFDVDRCEERFLPLLSSLVGLPFDPRRSSLENRQRIKEAVPLYRRKGTIPAIRRSLADQGWQGRIEETFRSALRLNRRARLDDSRLPGCIYSLGVLRVVSDVDASGVREELAFHHPAGTRVFFLQRLAEVLDGGEELAAPLWGVIRRVALGILDESFRVGRDALGSHYRLTLERKTWGVLERHSGVTLEPEIERSEVIITRWQGRGDRLRLNTKRLGEERLPNVWVSEVNFAGSCRIETRWRPPCTQLLMRLTAEPLNTARLNYAQDDCRIRFRQVDFYSELMPDAPVPRGEIQEKRLGNESQPRVCLTLGRARLSTGQKLGGGSRGGVLQWASLAQSAQFEVTEAFDLVNRWRRRGPVFLLNRNALGARSLTDANITEERASFELSVNTGLDLRRMTRPLRLSCAALNQAGPRWAEPDLRWRYRQKDLIAMESACFEAAANQLRITQWPS